MAETGLLRKPPTPDDLRTIAAWFHDQAARSKEDADHWGHRIRGEACEWAAKEIERLRQMCGSNLATMRRAKIWADQVSENAIGGADVRAVYAFDMGALGDAINKAENANG